jgi:hypothetical protein
VIALTRKSSTKFSGIQTVSDPSSGDFILN